MFLLRHYTLIPPKKVPHSSLRVALWLDGDVPSFWALGLGVESSNSPGPQNNGLAGYVRRFWAISWPYFCGPGKSLAHAAVGRIGSPGSSEDEPFLTDTSPVVQGILRVCKDFCVVQGPQKPLVSTWT